MATYADILEEFFFLRFPRAFDSFEAFEQEEGPEDRNATERLLKRMLLEAPLSAKHFLGVDYFPPTAESFAILDEHLTPEVAGRMMAASNPDDENNTFKLTVCELGAHLGAVLAGEYGGLWRFARFPNYFQSKLYLETIEVSVFDMVIKKCSSDYTHERICEKVQSIEDMLESIRSGPKARPN